MHGTISPLTVYGSTLSYFTGKLEVYLRAKNIAYTLEPMHGRRIMPIVRRATGTSQMPAVQLADGRWLSDTTPIIAWLEQQQPLPPVIPQEPVLRFFCLLLEDYADEWLWRPAMHFRWYYTGSALLQSRHLADELTAGVPVPPPLKRWYLRRRQRGTYTVGDGVTEANHRQVEAIYLNNLAWLDAALQQRAYLLGNSPSLADIAFAGPFLRHFSQDPVPAEIMKQRAPAVFEWVARLWNCRPESVTADWLHEIPEDWSPWLRDIGAVYLPYLCANAEAVAAGRSRFSPTVGGVTYRKARTSRYRMWCLEQLRYHFEALPESARSSVRDVLDRHGAWEPLWRVGDVESGVNRTLTPPFGSSHKMV
tara:strand:+ start:40874 stop:41965 length:1092 start_codon:yes stop_codon:yes gene_type:complete